MAKHPRISAQFPKDISQKLCEISHDLDKISKRICKAVDDKRDPCPDDLKHLARLEKELDELKIEQSKQK